METQNLTPEIWAEIDKFLGGQVLTEIEPGEVTIGDVAKRYKISEESARARLNALCESGLMSVRPAVRQGHKISAYKVVRE